ncbi:hypothetical protein [Pseudomonas sp.]|uniref:hypothetical protein n=1 Tax=Pseudomonas sp. TaxID=306 RepID=UPI003BB65E33
MLKIKSKITNPMTVIAIFAAISEASAAVSLPFLNNDDREFYVWFLITFPFYLLFLFFMTLNFNYRSLYSPSDFETDKSFLKAIDNNDRNSKRNTSTQDSVAPGFLGVSSCIVSAETVADPCQNTCKAHSVPDPPPDSVIKAKPVVQHHVQLAMPSSNLHIIDARGINAVKELNTLLEKIPRSEKKTGRLIIFISNHVSDGLLTQNALLQIKQAKKGSGTTPCIVYNVCSQAVTLLGRV